MIILGVDPGIATVGYGLVNYEKGSAKVNTCPAVVFFSLS